jgi:hypothetical protein
VNGAYAEYEVVGRRIYRGHHPGSRFDAALDPGAEQRAVDRGDIRVVRRVTPALQPGSYTFPPGWQPAGTRIARPPRAARKAALPLEGG